VDYILSSTNALVSGLSSSTAVSTIQSLSYAPPSPPGMWCDDFQPEDWDASQYACVAFSAILGTTVFFATLWEMLVIPSMASDAILLSKLEHEQAVAGAKVLALHEKAEKEAASASDHGQGSGNGGGKAEETIEQWHNRGVTAQEMEKWLDENKNAPFTTFFMWFSAYSTIKDLMVGRTQGNFKALNGVRCLTMGYIFLSHTFLILILGNNAIINYMPAILKYVGGVMSAGDIAKGSIDGAIFLGAFRSVDTFFFISGFLGVYLMMRAIEAIKVTETGGLCRFFKMYPLMVIQRYLRLTPIYAFILWWVVSMGPLLGRGPGQTSTGLTPGVPDYAAGMQCTGEYPPDLGDGNYFPTYWYHSLLYINNVVPREIPGASTCMGWGWYLANDFMYYTWTPFFLVLYVWLRDGISHGDEEARSEGLGSSADVVVKYWYGKRMLPIMPAIVLYCLQIILLGWGSDNYQMGMSTLSSSYSLFLYARPWFRYSPYVVGATLGLYYHEKKKIMSKLGLMINNNKDLPVEHLSYFKMVMYFISGTWMVVVTYIMPYAANMNDPMGQLGHGTWSQGSINAFNAFQLPTYSLGLAGICHMFFSGHGWFVKDFLECAFFDVMAKITYGMYLWSIFMMSVYKTAALNISYTAGQANAWLYIGGFVLAACVSFCSFVFVEKPFQNMSNALMGLLSGQSKKSSRSREAKPEETPAGEMVSQGSENPDDTVQSTSNPIQAEVEVDVVPSNASGSGGSGDIELKESPHQQNMIQV